MTYPHLANNIKRLEYCTSDNPLDAYNHKGGIMDESTSSSWIIHLSIVNYKDQWYLFYNDNDLSPDFDKNRSMLADSLFFEQNGNIAKVISSHRGVGITSDSSKIQVDRYSAKSTIGAAVEFLNRLDSFQGWKIVLNKPNAWVHSNKVNFGVKSPDFVEIRE